MYIPLVDAGLVLQAAVTKTGGFNGDWVDLGDSYAPGGLGQAVAGVVSVTALTGGNTYTFTLEETDADANGAPNATYGAIGAGLVVSATGIAVVKGLVTRRFVRLVLAISGGTPSITYSGALGV